MPRSPLLPWVVVLVSISHDVCMAEHHSSSQINIPGVVILLEYIRYEAFAGKVDTSYVVTLLVDHLILFETGVFHLRADPSDECL